MSDTGESESFPTSNYDLGGLGFIPDPDGFDKLMRQNGPVGAALKRWAEATREAAQRYAPVDTGRLRSSIGIEYYKDDDGIYADVGTDVEYAGFQELGTSRNPPHPFLRPALLEAMAELEAVTGDAEVVFGYEGEGDYAGVNEVVNGG